MIVTTGRKNHDFDWCFIDDEQFQRTAGYGVHKMVVTWASAVKKIGTMKYASPDFCCSASCAFIEVESESEAHSLISYLGTSFVASMMRILKSSTAKNTRSIMKKIPKVPLDRTWTNELVYEYFNVTPDEIDYLESL